MMEIRPVVAFMCCALVPALKSLGTSTVAILQHGGSEPSESIQICTSLIPISFLRLVRSDGHDSKFLGFVQ